jgi:hypothetical protein
MTDSHNPPTIITGDQKKNFVHEQDYEYSRDTYYDLIEKGRESLDLMIQVARESEHPRAFEVLSNMIKDIANVNDKLMELNKKQKDLLQDDKPKETTTTNNNLFVGSTTELQRFLLGDKDEKVIDQDDE